jgi:hypothetical protein
MQNDSLLAQIITFIIGLLSKGNGVAPIQVSIPLDPQAPSSQPSTPEIDWNSPDSKVTEHFTVGDACMLHSWNRLASDIDGFTPQMKANMITLCQKMEEIRTFLGCSMNVHCMFRSQQYNQEVVKAIPNDVHAQGLACDFDCNEAMTIDELHAKLEPVLEQYGIRMERNTPTWCHLDLHPVGNARYFTA